LRAKIGSKILQQDNLTNSLGTLERKIMIQSKPDNMEMKNNIVPCTKKHQNEGVEK